MLAVQFEPFEESLAKPLPVLLDGGSGSVTGTMKDPKLHNSPLITKASFQFCYICNAARTNLNVPDCYVHIIESDRKRSHPEISASKHITTPIWPAESAPIDSVCTRYIFL